MRTNKKNKSYKGPIRLFLSVLLLMSLSTIILIINGCKKTNGASEDSQGNYGNNPKSVVPDELVGYWIAGESSIGSFWGYDGSYQGAANEMAVGYMLYKDGRAKEYFYYTSTSTYCRDQVLGYKEGTVKIDPTGKTFEMFYASGNYRAYNSCGSSKSPGFGETKQYTSSELYPAKKMIINNWSLKEINGKKIMQVPLAGGAIQEYEKSTEPQK